MLNTVASMSGDHARQTAQSTASIDQKMDKIISVARITRRGPIRGAPSRALNQMSFITTSGFDRLNTEALCRRCARAKGATAWHNRREARARARAASAKQNCIA